MLGWLPPTTAGTLPERPYPPEGPLVAGTVQSPNFMVHILNKELTWQET